jgi:hypothetical protein
MCKGALLPASILLVAILGASAGSTKAGDATPSAQPGKMTSSQFQDAMRRLWEDHITYTRLYIISAAGNLPDKDATAQRLLQNQTDIGNAIKPFYGDAAGDQLTSLLKQHILGAVAIFGCGEGER